ncbi:MAG: dihydrofolate reductase [Gammaproteobacteria bacterium]|nr:dihydrofolate reductase [Gammaproteobacteria bacterium]
MRISAVIARSENNVIGLNNKLPWHMPADLKHFKQLTLGKPILMGRKTYESIGKPLPGRQNIILTQDKNFSAPNCTVVHSIAEAVKAAEGNDELCVIGGAQLFESMLGQIQTLYLTVIHADFDGDAYFPLLNPVEWHEIQRETFPADESNPYSYSFITLLRIASSPD